MNQLTPWPDWLEEVWAKSPVQDETTGESLAMHTSQVLARLSDLVRLRPQLPVQLGEPRLWHRLYWACFLHDLGKCAQGFQDILRGIKETPHAQQWGRHRHEVLSLPFVDWVFPPLARTDNGMQAADRRWVIAAIASHHRDCSVVQT